MTCAVVTSATIAQLLAQHWNVRHVAVACFHTAAMAESFDLCTVHFKMNNKLVCVACLHVSVHEVSQVCVCLRAALILLRALQVTAMKNALLEKHGCKQWSFSWCEYNGLSETHSACDAHNAICCIKKLDVNTFLLQENP